MLMRELNLKNKELINKLEGLEVEIKKIINDEPTWKLALQADLARQDPNIRRQKGYPEEHLYQHSPHWDILPENCIDLNGKMDPCGQEYLNLQMKLMAENNRSNASNGFPNKEVFFSLNCLEGVKGLDFCSNIRKKVSDISYKFLGGNSMALCAFYPPGGYIPWHHNGNAPGYNILLHFRLGGNGSFFTWDDGKIVEYKDKPNGWVCRAGRFLDTIFDNFSGKHAGGPGQPTPHVGVMGASWHSARTFDWRFTLSTITNSRELWLDIIDELEAE